MTDNTQDSKATGAPAGQSFVNVNRAEDLQRLATASERKA